MMQDGEEWEEAFTKLRDMVAEVSEKVFSAQSDDSMVKLKRDAENAKKTLLKQLNSLRSTSSEAMTKHSQAVLPSAFESELAKNFSSNTLNFQKGDGKSEAKSTRKTCSMLLIAYLSESLRKLSRCTIKWSTRFLCNSFILEMENAWEQANNNMT